MSVRRLLTTSLLFIVSLGLMAFQEEPTTPASLDMIPGLIWILLLLVGAGLLLLAWGQRDVDAFAVAHHEDHSHGHDEHGHEGDDHAAHDHESHDHPHEDTTAVVRAEDADEGEHTTVMPVPSPIGMSAVEPVMPVMVEVPDETTSVKDTEVVMSSVDTLAPQTSAMDIPVVTLPEENVPAVSTPDVEAEMPDTTPPPISPVEVPEPATPIIPMSMNVSEEDISLPVAASNMADNAPPTTNIDETEESEERKSTSSIGMRERPNFPKVEIPDTSPAAKGAVRDTMEFRMGEDNPGEVVQRPNTGDRPEPSPMSMGGGGLATAEVDLPELDVPDLGMPALDAATNEISEPDTEAIGSIANVSIEAGSLAEADTQADESFGDTPGLNGGDMVQKMGVMEDSEPAHSDLPGWFMGSVDTPATPTPAPTPPPTPVVEWENTTLEPPNTAEGAPSLPTITLPTYDSDLSEAPKWLVTGEDDDDGNDDLAIVEGIGPKIASVLNNAGIRSFRRLARTSAENLRDILDNAGISSVADPGTWGEQARHAADGAMDKLQELQERLKGGRKE